MLHIFGTNENIKNFEKNNWESNVRASKKKNRNLYPVLTNEQGFSQVLACFQNEGQKQTDEKGRKFWNTLFFNLILEFFFRNEAMIHTVL